MKIYDCFMYYDEDLCLDVRLNTLNEYVDFFIIVEAKYAHNGEKRKLRFNINNFKKFKNKIRYIVLDKQPKNLIKNNNKYSVDAIKILNAIKRENLQRNFIMRGIYDAKKDDLIIISDLDEIPNLSVINLKNIKTKQIYIFEQDFFYYKFNLQNTHQKWFGTRMCKFEFLKSPQWIRNVKPKKYKFFRIDTWFDEKKYQNVHFIKNGGWHFTYIKTPQLIQKKLKTYLHHQEYDANPLSITKIKKLVSNKKVIYDHRLDQTIANKFETGVKLKKISINKLPIYIKNNIRKFKNWLE